MGVYIKGMEMPISCWECYFQDCGNCILNAHKVVDNCIIEGRIDEDCPLVPVPPHGRLIDADALMKEFEKAENTMANHGQEYACSFMSSSQEISTEWYCVEDMLDNAPTIIEAEVAEC
jgi:hypothetical protein